jgi:hypothetical protein
MQINKYKFNKNCLHVKKKKKNGSVFERTENNHNKISHNNCGKISGTFDQLQPNERGILVHARQTVRRPIRYRRQSNTVWSSQRCV